MGALVGVAVGFAVGLNDGTAVVGLKVGVAVMPPESVGNSVGANDEGALVGLLHFL